MIDLNFVQVVSSNAKAIAWEPEVGREGWIHVLFPGGAHWSYGPFPPARYTALQAAESIGRYINTLKAEIKADKTGTLRARDHSKDEVAAPVTEHSLKGVRCPVCRAEGLEPEAVKHRTGCCGWALR